MTASSAAEVSSRLAACSSVRCDRSSDAEAICLAPVETASALSEMSTSVVFRLACAALKSRWIEAKHRLKLLVDWLLEIVMRQARQCVAEFDQVGHVGREFDHLGHPPFQIEDRECKRPSKWTLRSPLAMRTKMSATCSPRFSFAQNAWYSDDAAKAGSTNMR